MRSSYLAPKCDYDQDSSVNITFQNGRSSSITLNSATEMNAKDDSGFNSEASADDFIEDSDEGHINI